MQNQITAKVLRITSESPCAHILINRASGVFRVFQLNFSHLPGMEYGAMESCTKMSACPTAFLEPWIRSFFVHVLSCDFWGKHNHISSLTCGMKGIGIPALLVLLSFFHSVVVGDRLRVGQPLHDARQLQTTTLNVVGNNGLPSTVFPLKKCQGDCDHDTDCQSGLKCFQRDPGNSSNVPGCQGDVDVKSTNDYCFDPSDGHASGDKVHTTSSGSLLALVGNNGSPSKVFPLSKCQGDCDKDSDCAGNLQCFNRDPSATIVPGCNGKPVDSTDYCYDPSAVSGSQGRLVDKGVDHVPSKAYPLGLCEGDCDGDSDCAGDLVCHQTTGRNSVPSCVGRSPADTDYCIRPSSELARPPVSGAFRLKEHWEPGYKWQEEFWEQEWCMECGGSDCNVGDEIFIHECTEHSTWFVFANSVDTTAQIQIAATNLCLEWVDARDLRARTCDASVRRQKFRSKNGAFRSNDKFEILTYRGEGCLTQQHHPKDGEKIFRSDCERARQYDTSLWGEY
jgi:hypothetical protein